RGGGGKSHRHEMRALVEDPAHDRRRPRISRCLAARRAGAAGMEGARSGDLSPYLRPGVIAALVVLALDQASKLWLLKIFDIAHKGAVSVTPFFDLVLAMNPGISFGWFQNDGTLAQIVLLTIKAVAVIVLAIWMARSRTLLATLALGLIIGGARWEGYVFTLADVAIVAGVAALLYDSLLGAPAVKAP